MGRSSTLFDNNCHFVLRSHFYFMFFVAAGLCFFGGTQKFSILAVLICIWQQGCACVCWNFGKLYFWIALPACVGS